jgi:hypothetical protein
MMENDFDRDFLCVFSDGRSWRYRTKGKAGMRKVSAVELGERYNPMPLLI